MEQAKSLFSKVKNCEPLPRDSDNVSEEKRTDIVNRRIKYLTALAPEFSNKHWVIVRHMAEYGYFYDIACRKYLLKIEDQTDEKLAAEMLEKLRRKYKSYDDCKTLFGRMHEFYITGEMTFDNALSHFAFIMGSALRASFYYELQYEARKRRVGSAKMSVRDFHAKILEALRENLIVEAIKQRAIVMQVREEKKKVREDQIRSITEWFQDD